MEEEAGKQGCIWEREARGKKREPRSLTAVAVESPSLFSRFYLFKGNVLSFPDDLWHQLKSTSAFEYFPVLLNQDNLRSVLLA